jgi:quercetin dioxygenase-like cupin family protein
MNRVICICAAALVVAGVASAAGKPPILAQPLGVAHLSKPFTVTVSKPGDLLFAQVKIEPGGDFGWHYHRSAVVVAVVAGTLTLYDSSDPNCSPQHVKAGQGFVEQANHVHLARNDGTTPVRVLVAYLGAPHGKPTDVPAAQPKQCASIK